MRERSRVRPGTRQRQEEQGEGLEEKHVRFLRETMDVN